MKILTKFSQWYLTKQRIKQQKNQAKAQDNTNTQIYNNLKELYYFVNWLNTKGLGNRHQKKVFWSKIRNGEPLLEKTLNDLINQYAKRVENSPSPRPEKGKTITEGLLDKKKSSENKEN